MRNVLHAYIGSFDDLGRLTIVPVSDGTATTGVWPEPKISLLFSGALTEDQKDTLKYLGQALCQKIGGVLDSSGNENHAWPS